MASDFSILVRATLRLYYQSLTEAFLFTAKNWRMVILHTVLFAGVSLLAVLLSRIVSGIAGSFIIGIISTIAVSIYFLTVEGAASSNVVRFSEVRERVFDYFSPTLSVFFALFLINLLVQLLLPTSDTAWLRACVALFVTILFNPLPEIIYQKPGMMMQMFADALEFIKENFVEWFAPALAVLAFLGLFLSFTQVAELLIALSITNPLELLRLFMLQLLGYLLSPVFYFIPVFLFCLYFIFVFRGVLFLKLATSSRRKRIYQARFG